MYYIVCGTREEIIKERKEAGSSILERMRKARCRRKAESVPPERAIATFPLASKKDWRVSSLTSTLRPTAVKICSGGHSKMCFCLSFEIDSRTSAIWDASNSVRLTSSQSSL